MKIEQFEQQVIINEWQLGQELNKSVHSNARDKFNLLLSLLSDDARDFAEFEVVKSDLNVPVKDDLREHFNLPKIQPLCNEGPSNTLLKELNHDLHQTKLTDIRFKQLLTNEAILSQKQTQQLPSDILDNLPLIKKQRVEQAYMLTKSDVIADQKYTQGIDANLLDEYQNLDLKNKPVRLTYA